MGGHDCTAFFYVSTDGMATCQTCGNTWRA